MGFRNLLVNAAFAVARGGAKFDPSGIASNLIDRYEKQHDLGRLRSEFHDMMAAEFAHFRSEVAAAMTDLRSQLAAEQLGRVEAVLSAMQASAKQASRALGDASAKTVPDTVAVEEADQLAVFLPQTEPRFVVGSAVPGRPRWKLTEPLGAGGFGEVWKAENPHLGTAAVKFFVDQLARKRFTLKEADAVAEVLQKGPTAGVVQLRDLGPDEDPPWLMFEFIGGGDLAGVPARWQKLPGDERRTAVVGVLRTLAATAGHFHKLGVVHRDLKPSNILVRADGSLVVADFGISKIVPVSAALVPTPGNAGSVTKTIRAFTALYASPQQKKFDPADVRDDVYALGVIGYQLLVGDLSAEVGADFDEQLTDAGVSAELVALLKKCVARDPAKRPADGSELAKLLDAASERRDVSPPVVNIPPVVDSHRRADAAPLATKSSERRDVSPPVKVVTPNRRADAAPLARRPGEEVELPIESRTTSGILLPGSPSITFCWIPPGTAQLGSPQSEKDRSDDEDEEKRGVFTSKGFWLAKYPVTQEQWVAVMGTNPSWFQRGGDGKDKVRGLDTSRFPVEDMTWDLICRPGGFLSKLKAQCNFTTCFGAKGVLALPHEDEWEYACRGGKSNQQPFYWGAELNGTQANIDGNYPYGTDKKGPYLQRPTAVGTYAAKYPHPWGLCDMHGNVWEWCENLFNQKNHSGRVVRGGSGDDNGHCCRAACRSSSPPDLFSRGVGFRLLFRPDV